MPIRIPFLKLPASQPPIRREYQRRIAAVISQGRFILGEEVRCFEQEYARFCGAAHAIGVGNGTQALQVALRLSGVRPERGQEVITSPLTASFTAHAIVAAGGRPVFADVDADTLLLNAEECSRVRTVRTAAIVAVHLYGQCCDLSALGALAKQWECALVQDAAQAHGSRFGGRGLAEFSHWVTFSFYPTKNLAALGDGGALVTNSARLAEQARRYRDGGRDPARGGHVAQSEGINSRLDELQAAVLRVNLRYLSRWNRRRREIAALYDRLLASAVGEQVRTLARTPESASSHHLYVIRTRSRDRLIAYLRERGVEAAVHYEKPLHLHPAFRWLGYRRGAFPNAERAAREVCSLPLHPFLRDSEVEQVVESIAGFFRRGRV